MSYLGLNTATVLTMPADHPRRCAPQEPPAYLRVVVPPTSIRAREYRERTGLSRVAVSVAGRSDAGGKDCCADRSGRSVAKANGAHCEHRYRSTAHHQHRPGLNCTARSPICSASRCVAPKSPGHRLIRFRGCRSISSLRRCRRNPMARSSLVRSPPRHVVDNVVVVRSSHDARLESRPVRRFGHFGLG